MSEGVPKSAYEIAMERLRKKDQEEGVQEQQLTPEQKEAIAAARNVYESGVAEREILFQSALRRTTDPDAQRVLEEEYRRDRERLAYDRDRKIERIRSS